MASISPNTDSLRALLVGRLAVAGLDVRVAGNGNIVVRTSCSRTALRRTLFPDAGAVHITRPASGWYVLQLTTEPETPT